MAQARELSEAGELGDPEYIEGLDQAISAALDYGITSIAVGDLSPPTPEALLEQARFAARTGVQIEVVLARYVAGYTLLEDFLTEEAQTGGLLGSAELSGIRRALRALFNRILKQVGAAHKQEREAGAGTAERRRIEKVRRLLKGDQLDASDLAYDFALHHVGLIALGAEAASAVAELAQRADRRLLTVRLGPQTVWAWLGSRHPESLPERKLLVARHWPSHLPLSVGEPATGIDGWRLTHRQADATRPIVRGERPKQAHYAEFALSIAVREDELLADSLREIYLKPLSRERDGGETLLRTLRAYLDADRQVSPAAAALAVSRQTITNRLKKIEGRLGRPLGACLPELDAALRLSGLDPSPIAG